MIKRIISSRFFIVVTSVLLCFGIISIYTRNSFDAENFAMGEESTAHFGVDDGFPIHLNRLEDTSMIYALDGWSNRGKKPVCLLLGNSQTQGINQFHENDETYVMSLHRKINRYDVLAHSIQNACLQELLVSAVYMDSKLPIKTIVIPIFYDDLREDGIREVFFADLKQSKFVLDSALNPIIADLNAQLNSFYDEEVETENEQSTQAIVENYIEKGLSKRFKSWEARSEIRGKLFADLYKTRNSLFQINAQTIRKKIPIRYDKNIQALKSIIKYTSDHDIKLIVYVPPIRNDISLPYNVADYEKFKQELEAICLDHDHLIFKNFERIVPAKFWGLKSSTSKSGKLEYDFMHFQAKGHQILDSALLTIILDTPK